MMTSQVLLTGPSGKKLVVRALLDSGANTSVISSKVMESLQLKKLDTCVTLAGIGGPDQTPTRPTAQVVVSSPYRKEWSQLVTVAAMPKITDYLPRQGASSIKKLPHIKDMQLADPHFHEHRRIDLLLGVEVLNEILLPERVKVPKGTPTAWHTELGWGIMGRYTPDQPSSSRSVSVHTANQAAEPTPSTEATVQVEAEESVPTPKDVPEELVNSVSSQDIDPLVCLNHWELHGILYQIPCQPVSSCLPASPPPNETSTQMSQGG